MSPKNARLETNGDQSSSTTIRTDATLGFSNGKFSILIRYRGFDLSSTCGISIVAGGRILPRIQTLLKSFQKNVSKVSLVPLPKPMITYANPGALLI